MNQNYEYTDSRLESILPPKARGERLPVPLTDRTMQERLDKVIEKMHHADIDALVIYEDLEHGSNFEYLTGFLTRFEEGVLVLHKNRSAYLLLGNENTKMVNYSRIPAQLIHVPYFSLPNQPMENDRAIVEYFREAGIGKGQRIGVVGWKMFTGRMADNRKLFDIPGYLVDALKAIVGEEYMENSCHLFIGGCGGARTINNANEIAHYEYGSALASDRISLALNQVRPGVSEMELGGYLNAAGQPNSVVTVAATGERFQDANLYPTDKKVSMGDKMSLTVGYKGGLSSRAGYAAETAEQLPEANRDYVERLAAPYFTAVTAWLETIRIGMTGGELYRNIQKVLPRERYHWSLNPGHLTGDEEWMSSPVYAGSEEILRSGMLLQIDIIPSVSGYAGAGCESGIALADDTVRERIKAEYPELYQVFRERQRYIRQVINIRLPDEVLPMNDTVAYYRPFFFNRDLAFVRKRT